MATNEILRFAETDTGTNLLTQAEYLADSQRPIGNQPGVARSKLVNKALRQASLIAAGLAEYIADNQANNITDALTPQNIADYLQAAITGALGVTPPQFDNDTSLATTAFVQRALGNVQFYYGVSSATTLTAISFGQMVGCSGGSAYTVTLPAANAGANGGVIWFQSTASVPITIQRAGSDLIFADQTGGLTSITLNPGDTLALVTNNVSGWGVLSGSAVLKNSSQFGRLLSSAGYQKLPGGLIIQWGNIATSGSGGVTLTYPIAFPNAVVSGSMQLVSSPSSAAVHPGMDFSGLSSMTVYTRDATSGRYTEVNCKYILIGY